MPELFTGTFGKFEVVGTVKHVSEDSGGWIDFSEDGGGGRRFMARKHGFESNQWFKDRVGKRIRITNITYVEEVPDTYDRLNAISEEIE